MKLNDWLCEIRFAPTNEDIDELYEGACKMFSSDSDIKQIKATHKAAKAFKNIGRPRARRKPVVKENDNNDDYLANLTKGIGVAYKDD